MRKSLCLVFILSILFSSCFPVFAANNGIIAQGTSDELTWSLSSSGVLEISGSGSMRGYPYGSTPWYKYASSIYSIVVDPNVSKIGAHAFYGCSNVESITVPFIGDQNHDILDAYQYPLGWLFGENRFDNCDLIVQYYYKTPLSVSNYATSTEYHSYYIPKSLKSITLTNCQTIGQGTFYHCWMIKEICIATSIVDIGHEAFEGCKSLSDINLPNSVASIGSYAFRNCSSLTEITVPVSVQNLWEGTFKGCKNLRKITIPFVGETRTESISTLQFPLGYLFGCEPYENANAVEQKYYEAKGVVTSTIYYIPDSLQSVTVTDCKYLPYGAFYGCTKLEEISLPDGLLQVGGYAFYNCRNLTEIIIPETVNTMGYSIFNGCSSLQKISIPFVGDKKDSTERTQYSFGYIFGNQEYTGSVGVIDYYSSQQKQKNYLPISLLSVNLTDCKYLPDFAFYDCASLKTINLPSSLTRIGKYAFYGCRGLSELIIPENVSSIGFGAFNNTNLSLMVKKGSFAENYAVENQIPYEIQQEYNSSILLMIQRMIELLRKIIAMSQNYLRSI